MRRIEVKGFDRDSFRDSDWKICNLARCFHVKCDFNIQHPFAAADSSVWKFNRVNVCFGQSLFYVLIQYNNQMKEKPIIKMLNAPNSRHIYLNQICVFFYYFFFFQFIHALRISQKRRYHTQMSSGRVYIKSSTTTPVKINGKRKRENFIHKNRLKWCECEGERKRVDTKVYKHV